MRCVSTTAHNRTVLRLCAMLCLVALSDCGCRPQRSRGGSHDLEPGGKLKGILEQAQMKEFD